MKESKNRCNEALQVFKQEHPSLFQQPIIQSFLQDEKHQEFVKQAICSPTEQNMQILDEAFQEFYGEVKALTYLSNVIYYNAINFDKAMKKHYNREMLTLDQPLQGENEGATHKDMLYHSSPSVPDRVVYETMADYVEDPQLYQAIQKLTSKQREILTHKYVHGLKNKEIADLFDDSPQNISKLHQSALKKLKNYLQKEQDSHDDS
ncbi:sigma-70 family RNA polymerase sigma factor [Lentibacillus sp. L22]|uniref:sigma-70 family RNA polymerase sigma factor n=1 Tax=Lentibacillus sp. L22 TaxID=3163028 RepID=UPI0034650A21